MPASPVVLKLPTYSVTTTTTMTMMTMMMVMMMMMQAMTETESSLSLHVVGAAQRHSRDYTLRADNDLGSDSDVITLAVVAPPGDASGQQDVADRSKDDVVVVMVTSRTTPSSPKAALTSNSASIDNGIS